MHALEKFNHSYKSLRFETDQEMCAYSSIIYKYNVVINILISTKLKISPRGKFN